MRFLFYIVIAILVLTAIRMFAGVITKGMGGLFSDENTPAGPNAHQPSVGGELKRDPVCGTFVSTTTSLRKQVGGEIVYFCSVACRDRYSV